MPVALSEKLPPKMAMPQADVAATPNHRHQLRGMSFDEGAQALKPPAPRQNPEGEMEDIKRLLLVGEDESESLLGDGEGDLLAPREDRAQKAAREAEEKKRRKARARRRWACSLTTPTAQPARTSSVKGPRPPPRC